MILDAAERCYERYGFAKTSIADIADEAGYSRTNVYRFFAGREGVFDAVVARAVARRFPELQAALASCSDASTLIVEATVLTLQMIHDEPAMVETAHQLRHGGEKMGTFIGEPVRLISRTWAEELVKSFSQVLLDELRDGLTPGLVGEHILMTILQLLAGITLIGDSDDPDDVRWYVTNFVLPGILGDATVTPRKKQPLV
jgi:AcrR family transcriptional regulator